MTAQAAGDFCQAGVYLRVLMATTAGDPAASTGTLGVAGNSWPHGLHIGRSHCPVSKDITFSLAQTQLGITKEPVPGTASTLAIQDLIQGTLLRQ